MADDDYDEIDADTDVPAQDNPRDLRRQLKEAKAKAKDNDELRAENARLKQDGIIRDAGLTLNDRQRLALQATHEGSWTPDAIKTTAADLGFFTPPAPAPDDPSVALQDQISAAAAGTDAPPASRDAQIDAELAGATSEAEFLAAYRASGRPISL